MSAPLTVWVPGGGPFVAPAKDALEHAATWWEDETPPAADRAVRVLVSGTPGEDWLDALPHLERVIIPYAGVPPRTAALVAARPGLHLHNLHHNADPTAEMALALLLAVTKRIPTADESLRRGDWRFRYRDPATWTLAGRRAVVLGWGAIGTRIGRMLAALDMHVTGVRRRPSADARGSTPVVGLDRLASVLRDADVLVLASPATDATRGLVDADLLARLPRGAVLVNVARGALVDERALYDALVSGHVGGAGLDVWWRYPRTTAARRATAPTHLPFHELDNVVFSPHRGGLTVETETLRGRALARLLDQIATGADVDHRVDPERGY